MRLHYLLFLLIYTVFSCSSPSANSEESTTETTEKNLPNIIFIMADDLGYGDLGSYGQKVIQTPHLDQMAKEGLRFTQCYTGSPVCAPSRSVLMTGLHTGHTTVRGNMGKGGVKGLGGANGRIPLNKEDITVATSLKMLGYTTGMIGKWGLGEPNTTGEPNDHGFDEWFGYLNQRRAHNYYPDFLWKNKEKYPLPGNVDGQEQQYSHDLFIVETLDFVNRHHDKPFFLYLPYTIPHDKYQIPSTDPYTEEPWEDNEKVHAAMVTLMDKDLGRLFSLMKSLNIDEKTIVFFCSDNGAARRWEGRFDSSGPLKGRKRDTYEGGIRTPMIVRWPGKIAPNTVDSTTAWYFADVMPTLLDIAGGEMPDNIDGISVLPSLLGKGKSTSDRVLYWEFHEKGGKQALRQGDWKIVRLDVQKKGFHKDVELYNLSSDPYEQKDIADAHSEKVKALIELMDAQHQQSEAFPYQFEEKVQ